MVTIWLQFLHILLKKQYCVFFRKFFSKPLDLELTPVSYTHLDVYKRQDLTMALKNQYLIDLLETVKKRNAGEPEFIQAVTEVFESRCV